MDQPNFVANTLPCPFSAQQPAAENAGASGASGAAVSAAQLSAQLFIALGECDLAEIQRILDQDHVDLSLKNNHGLTPLHFSMIHCPSEVFFSILHCRHDAHVNEPNNHGYRPFNTLLWGGGWEEDMLKMDALVKAKADINLPVMDPVPHPGVSVEISTLQMAIDARNPNGVRLLLSAGADANQNTRYNCPPIVIAVINRQPAIVKLLLNAKANPNIPCTDTASENFGRTALNFAIEEWMKSKYSADDDIIKVLLQAGAEIDVHSIQLAKDTPHILDLLLEGKCKTPDEEGMLLEAAFDSVASQFQDTKGMEDHEFHIAGTMFSKGFYNLSKIFASAIHDVELKEKFISSSLQDAIDQSNYPAIDAMRDLGATLYQDLTKENTTQNRQKTSKESIREPSWQISEEGRDEIYQEICKEENYKFLHEKTAITNFSQYCLYFHCERPEEYLQKPFIEDSTVLKTLEDKVFFHELMGPAAKKSYSYLETVIVSKINFDEALENTWEKWRSIDTPTDGFKALEDSLDACAPTTEADACLIASAPEH